jgi:hypothetical protein
MTSRGLATGTGCETFSTLKGAASLTARMVSLKAVTII